MCLPKSHSYADIFSCQPHCYVLIFLLSGTQFFNKIVIVMDEAMKLRLFMNLLQKAEDAKGGLDEFHLNFKLLIKAHNNAHSHTSLTITWAVIVAESIFIFLRQRVTKLCTFWCERMVERQQQKTRKSMSRYQRRLCRMNCKTIACLVEICWIFAC